MSWLIVILVGLLELLCIFFKLLRCDHGSIVLLGHLLFLLVFVVLPVFLELVLRTTPHISCHLVLVSFGILIVGLSLGNVVGRTLLCSGALLYLQGLCIFIDGLFDL